MVFESALKAKGADYELPPTQGLANAAIIAVFAYLVPLLTMEINYFRLAAYKSWRRLRRMERNTASNAGKPVFVSTDLQGEEEVPDNTASAEDPDDDCRTAPTAPTAPTVLEEQTCSPGPYEIELGKIDSLFEDFEEDVEADQSVTSSAVGHLVHEVRASLLDTKTNECSHPSYPVLRRANKQIRMASLQSVVSSLIVYSLTATAIGLLTKGIDDKVVAIVVGSSQFIAALLVFIVSTKIPQWFGVYHQGSIRLVKCYSDFSKNFECVDLRDEGVLRRLRTEVRLGVCFHFSKFYIILWPFMCGVQPATIPVSIVLGSVVGFLLMGFVFVVHERYIHYRNCVSYTTILVLSIISALVFVRGMAWIQFVWQLNILSSEDTLIVISFFSWLVLLMAVHALFIRHTIGFERKLVGETDALSESGLSEVTPKAGNGMGKRKGSYSSFVFDPMVHFSERDMQFSGHPDCDNISATSSSLVEVKPNIPDDEVGLSLEEDDDGKNCMGTNDSPTDGGETDQTNYTLEGKAILPADQKSEDAGDADRFKPKKKRPTWYDVFVCHSPEYRTSSCLWKSLIWIKIAVILTAYLLCIYFIVVSIGATHQASLVQQNLPAVQVALYDNMNEGPVCAFDNKGRNSNITTFVDKDSAHEAGFLILHCGACAACSTWDNLIVEYVTRDTMAKHASKCARDSLLSSQGNDAITECLMQPHIGFDEQCAVCWMEDIVCTKKHCTFIFLQSQMINQVSNFAVGPEDITSATCEEAHCEVGQFVPCSGATRRRMNITSSIARPGEQQCGIVDVDDLWGEILLGEI